MTTVRFKLDESGGTGRSEERDDGRLDGFETAELVFGCICRGETVLVDGLGCLCTGTQWVSLGGSGTGTLAGIRSVLAEIAWTNYHVNNTRSYKCLFPFTA